MRNLHERYLTLLVYHRKLPAGAPSSEEVFFDISYAAPNISTPSTQEDVPTPRGRLCGFPIAGERRILRDFFCGECAAAVGVVPQHHACSDKGQRTYIQFHINSIIMPFQEIAMLAYLLLRFSTERANSTDTELKNLRRYEYLNSPHRVG